jgi:hypothetical protein
LQDCFEALSNAEVDWTTADPMMLYFLNRDWGGTPKAMAPIVKEVRSNAPERSKGTGSGEGADYKALAIIGRDLCQRYNEKFTLRDARGMRSCHTRYGDVAGWAYPVYEIASEGLSGGKDDISVVKNFFKASCAAGNGGQGICTNCANQQYCDLDDAFAGGDGVLDCLRSGQGDIGFVDHYTAMGSGLDGDSGAENIDDFRVVCSDGCYSLERFHEVRRRCLLHSAMLLPLHSAIRMSCLREGTACWTA